jgi:hypothetical protein
MSFIVYFFLAVFAAFLKAAAVGAPFVPGFLIFSLEPALILFLLACMFAYSPLGIIPPYHFLQDQYLAVNLLGGLVSHLCLALNDLRLFGWSFLIVMLGSPKRMSLVLSPCFASTANFLDLPGVRFGLL